MISLASPETTTAKESADDGVVGDLTALTRGQDGDRVGRRRAVVAPDEDDPGVGELGQLVVELGRDAGDLRDVVPPRTDHDRAVADASARLGAGIPLLGVREVLEVVDDDRGRGMDGEAA